MGEYSANMHKAFNLFLITGKKILYHNSLNTFIYNEHINYAC